MPITLIKRVMLGQDPYWKQYFWNKWGFLSKELKQMVKGKKTIWIDCLGGGEVTQIVTFTKLLRSKFPEYRIVLSTNNPFPFKFAKKNLDIDFVFDIPWDISFVARRVLRIISPVILIVVDQVRFPIILIQAKRLGIKTVLISAALANEYYKSDYMKRAAAFGFYRYFDYIGVTENRDLRAFLELGVQEDKISVSGNMKYDVDFIRTPEDKKYLLRQELKLSEDEFIFVAGSVHVAEASLIMKGYQKAKQAIPNLRMIFVPRYIETIAKIEHIAKSLRLDFVRRTEIDNADSLKDGFILVNTFGEQSRLFSLASVIFIGNSLIPRDRFALGQNIIEPLIHCKPIFFGRYMNKWRAITDELKEVWQDLEIIDDNDLAQGLIYLRDCPDASDRISNKAYEIVKRNKNGIVNNLYLVSKVMGS
jgi:3-deoxy-D-manno-octulosonic-acid transferase